MAFSFFDFPEGRHVASRTPLLPAFPVSLTPALSTHSAILTRVHHYSQHWPPATGGQEATWEDAHFLGLLSGLGQPQAGTTAGEGRPLCYGGHCREQHQP